MQQRASLCRALIHAPALLMLDEPFAALDAFTREELWCVLATCGSKIGFTMILVTHDLSEATLLADRVHVMSRARPHHLRASSTCRVRATLMLPQFIDIVHELRDQIAQVRTGMNADAGEALALAVHDRHLRLVGARLPSCSRSVVPPAAAPRRSWRVWADWARS